MFICSSSTKQFNLRSYFKQIRFLSAFHFHFKICPCGSCGRCGRSQQIHPSWLNRFCKGVINTGSQRRASQDASPLSHKMPNVAESGGTGAAKPGRGALTGTQLQARRSSFPQPDFLLVPITTARLAGGERNIKTLIKSSRLSHVWALSLSVCYVWLGFKFL